MFFIDVQGTLIDDDKRLPIKGSVDFINRLNEKEIPYIVITNNTKNSSDDFLEYLNSVGLYIDKEHYLDPLMVLKDVLKEKNIAAYGSSPFIEVLKKMGYILDYENPNSVLLGIKKDFLPDEYAQMIEFLLQGATLTGMHATTLYAKDGKRYPGVGAILEMLRFATGKEYDVVGKPSVRFYEKALEKISRFCSKRIDFKEITIISDDVKGDLTGAKRVGMKTVFVLSGKYKKADEIVPFLDENEKPDLICKDIEEAAEKSGVL
ncbi:HAD-IIA family hydrolase [Nitrosophilus alvini]|uniref:HAD-IIA family hydrolase n=1 Tax=Nitrosophilus alvini TaxID=2714855 RepID=UPI001F48E96A|nr:HAD-IIA family hydrolase [Nitrosophilus alvini]